MNFLTHDKAIKMLPDKKMIHTFRSVIGIALGCNWPREDVIELLNDKHLCQLAGEKATELGHGIAVMDDKGWLFIETKEP